MGLMRWDPLRGAFSLWNGRSRLPSVEGSSPVGLMDLALDMYETEDSVVVELSVPGMSPEDIQVRVTGNRLTVEGELKGENKTENRNYVLQERRYGRFERTFTLPRGVDVEAIRATFDDGVLRIEMPKREEARPRRIRVDVSRNAGEQTEKK